MEVFLNTTLTPELIREGEIRELIHSINQERKRKGFVINEIIDWELDISLTYEEKSYVEKETLTKIK